MSGAPLKHYVKYCLSFVAVSLLLLSVPSALSQRITSTGQRKIARGASVSYPKMAVQLRLQGTVKVLATVAPSGKVLRTELIGGSPVFVPYALDAIKLMKWEPAPQETKELLQVEFVPTERR
jgi:TonB family protein